MIYAENLKFLASNDEVMTFEVMTKLKCINQILSNLAKKKLLVERS